MTASLLEKKPVNETTTEKPLRRVLIVSPHFPPVNAPDHQRVRMSLPYFREYGWEPVVLAVEPDYVEGKRDEKLAESIPADIEIIRTKCVSPKLTRKVGLGSLGLRALPEFNRTGCRLLREKDFDLCYFSTTMFPCMILGPRWEKEFGVPYILDFQDPWITDYYERPGAPTPPGGWGKYRFSKWIAERLEPRALSSPAHIISVSPAYPGELQARYSHLHGDQFTVLPFGGNERDFDLADEFEVTQNAFNSNDGLRHWVYVGVVGKIMERALNILFEGIADSRKQNPDKWTDVRLHFIGTSYSAGDAEPSVLPVAKTFGIEDIVYEETQRVPFFEAIKILKDSTLVLMVGSDDKSYTASKLYPCILSKRPILALFHEESSVVDIFQRCRPGRMVSFGSREPDDSSCELRESLAWALAQSKNDIPQTDWQEFKPYTARAMARRQCEIFDHCAKGRITTS